MKPLFVIILSITCKISECQSINNIPKEDSSGWNEYSYVLKCQSDLRLKTLLHYSGKTTLRFWRFTNYMSSLTEISKAELKWDVKKYNFKLHIGQKLWLSLISKEKPLITGNLDSFFVRVTCLGFDTLKTQDEIKIEDVNVDGVLYCFEYLDKLKYNFYYYGDPKLQQKKYPQARVVSEIIDELNKTINSNSCR